MCTIKMCNSIVKTIHSAHGHYGWDNRIEPVHFAKPGQSFEFECVDSAGGQLSRNSTAQDINNLDFSLINPVTGPVFIEGAEPGDILKITLDGFKPSGFGWTANIPGFGLLADQFKEPALTLWEYDSISMAPALFGKHGKVPLKPFAGTIGLALAENGVHSVIPPRRVGGNMDIRDLSTGSELYLPVEVAGALFSIGDTHAAQGDGEVCGTAIESPMSVQLTFDLIKQQPLKFPRFRTSGPVTRHLDAKGYDVTTGVGTDLLQGARDAVAQMVDLLSARHNLDPVQAYMLCSVCGDLRISEIVDMPHVLVSFYFPRVVFE